MRVTSSTSHSLWYNCPYGHYLYCDYGIVNKADNLHTTFGLAVHQAIEDLCLNHSLFSVVRELEMSSIADIQGVTADGYPRSKEVFWLAESLATIFKRYYLEDFKKKYRIYAVEQEMVVELSDWLHWMCRPDLILERDDGRFFNGNIKTSGYIKDLKETYEFSIQMLMEAHAVSLHRKLDTGGTVILGLSKGQKGKLNKRDQASGKTGDRQDSPLTYVWWDKGTYSFQWTARAEKVGVWTFNQSPSEWIDKLPEDVAKAQIDITDPIEHGKGLKLEQVLEDILTVETLASKYIHPHNYDACNSYGTYKRPCAYKLWCHGTEQERADNFVPRTPHHPFEQRLQDDNKELELLKSLDNTF